jgi:hypothetical protein
MLLPLCLMQINYTYALLSYSNTATILELPNFAAWF